MKRTKSIKIRLTEAEHLALLEKKQGKELATWLRKLGLGDTTRPKYNSDLVRQVIRIGTNINQIARAVNQSSNSGSPIDKARVALELNIIRHQLNSLLQLEQENDS